MTRNTYTTREDYLRAAVVVMTGWLKEHEAIVPDRVQALVGWPKGGKAEVIGQCFSPTNSVDEKTHYLFISPRLGDHIEVLATLLHELVHAAVGIKEGHKGHFRRVCKALGFAGKMTHTYAEAGSELHARLTKLSEELGDYPHTAMRPSPKKDKDAKPKGWARYKSITEESYTIQIGPKALKAHGPPTDPWGEEMVPVFEGGGDDADGGED